MHGIGDSRLGLESKMRWTPFVLVIALVAALAPREAISQSASARNITVMTWNVYSGAGFNTVLSATSPSQLLNAMVKLFRQVKRTDFEDRAIAIADEIQSTKPHLIGLQEVALWRTQSPGDGPLSGAQHVEFDFLEILQDELHSRGLNYDAVAIFNGFDFEAPGLFADGLKDVRFTDRDVILARHSSHVQISNIKTRRFQARFTLPLGMNYPRGWESVNVNFYDKSFRFINTHLEALSASVNESQASELIAGPIDVNKPVIVVGDFNSPANVSIGEAYELLVHAGLTDVWPEARPNDAGNTCCQDSDLQNDQSHLSSRIDLIFVEGSITIRSAKRIGESVADQTASGLWPSDHAGVVAKLRLD